MEEMSTEDMQSLIVELQDKLTEKDAEIQSILGKLEETNVNLIKARELNNKLWDRQTTGTETEPVKEKSYEELMDDLFKVASSPTVTQMKKIFGEEMVNDNYRRFVER